MEPRQKSPGKRRYIRHPSEMPLQFCRQGDMAPCERRLRNISQAGLCFRSGMPLSRGDRVHIRIPVLEQRFEADGGVVWCRRAGNEYDVGIQFVDPDVRFAVRMVEQLCHIDAYRRKVLRDEGRELSSEAAAEEWIARFAAGFPTLV